MKRLLLFSCFFWIMCSTFSSYAQSNTVTSEGQRLGVVYPFENTTASNLAPEKKKLLKATRTVPNFGEKKALKAINNNALPMGIDPVLQTPTFTPPLPPILPKFNIEGINQDEADGVAPPDVNGDVSPDYYFQAVNASFYQIFDRHTGDAITGVTPASSFWAGLGFTGDGDPIVLYDQEADRWVFLEFSVAFQSTLALAISSTNDPTGAWTAYEFQTIEFPDYPKLGQWQDSYFLTSNEGGQNAVPVYFLEREALLNGEATFGVQTMLEITKFQAPDAFQVAAPIDWDGSTLPDATTGPMAIRMYDDSWGTEGVDRLEIWEFSIDWDNPSNSGVASTYQIPTSPFESTVCSGSIFQCLEQPSGDLISALQHVIMNRPTYRKFTDHESIVCAHTVDVDGNDKAGVRWYELRRTATEDWHVYQEGTIAPDNDHRFMPTIAIDVSGNIALAYAVTGEETELSLRYTARRNGDALGQMTYDEYEVATGLSTNLGERWGDYFNLSVDPVAQNEFWLTGEYMRNNNIWGTKITAFAIHRDSIDIGPLALVAPESDTLLSSSESLTASFRNFGLTTQNNFWVGYELEDGTFNIDTINYTLAPDGLYMHTFAETVDLSVVGDHHIKLFSGLINDAVPLNDTTRQIVSHLPRFDVKVGNTSSVIALTCDSMVNIDLAIQNNGLTILTSAIIDVSVNGGAITQIPWTGNLEYLASDNVSIPVSGLIGGDNDITINVHSPNGVMDEIPNNNSRTFTTDYLENSDVVTFLLTTDNYPYEVSWELATTSGNIIYESEPYSGFQSITDEQSWCLDLDSCYVFTIYDSYGDGLSTPSGSYTITNSNGIILASIINVNFGSVEQNQFCTEFDCTVAGTASSSPESTGGANDGSIIITTSNGIAPFMYSINGGGSFQSSALFNNLTGGIYDVIIRDAAGCETEFQVEVLTCTMQTMIDVVNESVSNANDGSITITASMGDAPYEYSIDGGDTFSSNNEFTNLTGGIYEVVVKDANDCTYTENVEVSTTVGTSNHNYGFNVTIAPNPTDGLIDISVNGIQDISMLELLIFDNTGSRVHKGRLAKYNDYLRGKVSLRHLPDGVYFIQFQHPSLSKNMAKIIKQ